MSKEPMEKSLGVIVGLILAVAALVAGAIWLL